MKFPWTIWSAVALCCCVSVSNSFARTALPNVNKTTHFVKADFSERDINERLTDLKLPFAVKNTPTVRSRIQRYVVDGSRDAEKILGRTAMYFPVFEHYLRLYNLPDALKYLPIVESTLRPMQVSPVGAAGLWQFVPATGRAMGLTINNVVDERLDTYRSTEAAVKMLSNLYEEFGDWALALAAYNCGPGRVRQAIRRAGSTDFWALRGYLPKESQRYVPAFIAAAYLVNFYQAHGLQPEFPDYDLQETRVFKVYDRMSLATLAKKCGIELSTLRNLNPGYRQNVIPRSEEGNFLVLPASAEDAFTAAYQPNSDRVEIPQDHIRSTYLTVPGDEIETLAQLFRCKPEDLKRWNRLRNAEITVNQPLVVFLPKPGVRP
jgi:membrane-bound lytic murein transglycosylase D